MPNLTVLSPDGARTELKVDPEQTIATATETYRKEKSTPAQHEVYFFQPPDEYAIPSDHKLKQYLREPVFAIIESKININTLIKRMGYNKDPSIASDLIKHLNDELLATREKIGLSIQIKLATFEAIIKISLYYKDEYKEAAQDNNTRMDLLKLCVMAIESWIQHAADFIKNIREAKKEAENKISELFLHFIENIHLQFPLELSNWRQQNPMLASDWDSLCIHLSSHLQNSALLVQLILNKTIYLCDATTDLIMSNHCSIMTDTRSASSQLKQNGIDIMLAHLRRFNHPKDIPDIQMIEQLLKILPPDNKRFAHPTPQDDCKESLIVLYRCLIKIYKYALPEHAQKNKHTDLTVKLANALNNDKLNIAQKILFFCENANGRKVGYNAPYTFWQNYKEDLILAITRISCRKVQMQLLHTLLNIFHSDTVNQHLPEHSTENLLSLRIFFPCLVNSETPTPILKDEILSPVVMAYIIFHVITSRTIDSSVEGINTILTQIINKNERVLAYGPWFNNIFCELLEKLFATQQKKNVRQYNNFVATAVISYLLHDPEKPKLNSHLDVKIPENNKQEMFNRLASYLRTLHANRDPNTTDLFIHILLNMPNLKACLYDVEKTHQPSRVALNNLSCSDPKNEHGHSLNTIILSLTLRFIIIAEELSEISSFKKLRSDTIYKVLNSIENIRLRTPYTIPSTYVDSVLFRVADNIFKIFYQLLLATNILQCKEEHQELLRSVEALHRKQPVIFNLATQTTHGLLVLQNVAPTLYQEATEKLYSLISNNAAEQDTRQDNPALAVASSDQIGNPTAASLRIESIQLLRSHPNLTLLNIPNIIINSYLDDLKAIWAINIFTRSHSLEEHYLSLNLLEAYKRMLSYTINTLYIENKKDETMHSCSYTQNQHRDTKTKRDFLSYVLFATLIHNGLAKYIKENHHDTQSEEVVQAVSFVCQFLPLSNQLALEIIEKENNRLTEKDNPDAKQDNYSEHPIDGLITKFIGVLGIFSKHRFNSEPRPNSAIAHIQDSLREHPRELYSLERI